MLHPLLHQNPPHISRVPQWRPLFDLVWDLRVLREDLLLQKLLAKWVRTYLVDGHVDEFWLFVEADVVVTDEWVLLKFNAEVVGLVLGQTLSQKVVPNTHLSIQDKVHLRDLIFFVKNETVLRLAVKFRWSEAKADFKEEVFIVYLVLDVCPWETVLRLHFLKKLVKINIQAPRNEESPESEYYIIEEIVKNNVVLDLFWTLAQVFIVNLHIAEPVFRPKERKMTVDLVD